MPNKNLITCDYDWKEIWNSMSKTNFLTLKFTTFAWITSISLLFAWCFFGHFIWLNFACSRHYPKSNDYQKLPIADDNECVVLINGNNSKKKIKIHPSNITQIEMNCWQSFGAKPHYNNPANVYRGTTKKLCFYYNNLLWTLYFSCKICIVATCISFLCFIYIVQIKKKESQSISWLTIFAIFFWLTTQILEMINEFYNIIKYIYSRREKCSPDV